MKHTPGPWRVTAVVFPFEVVSDEPSVLIADVGPNNVPVALANAHLIAAAPELFAICKEMLSIVEAARDFDDIDIDNDVIAEVSNKAASAIAKAEGREDAT